MASIPIHLKRKDLLGGTNLDGYLAGGPDRYPFMTTKEMRNGAFVLTHLGDESTHLCANIELPGVGRVMGTTGNLMPREKPYNLLLELLRGKICRLRNQSSDWEMLGLETPPHLKSVLSQLCQILGRVVTCEGDDVDENACIEGLVRAHKLGDEVTAVYTQRVLEIRKERTPKLPTRFAVGLGENFEPFELSAAALANFPFHQIHIPFPWRQLEPVQGQYQWQKADRMIESAMASRIEVSAGPIIDFRHNAMPDWIMSGKVDPHRLSSYLTKHLHVVLNRYQGIIRHWTILLGANLGEVFDLDEDEWLRLSFHLCDVAAKSGSKANLVLGISQPAGELMANEPRNYSPLGFAETMVRTGLPLAAIELDMVMGTSPRGGALREILEVSRMIDAFGFLGKPIRLVVGFPSAGDPDPLADPGQAVGPGRLGAQYTAEGQQAWVRQYLELLICKPQVEEIRWCHFDDRAPHVYPYCGLIDTKGQLKPAFGDLLALRRKHLI